MTIADSRLPSLIIEIEITTRLLYVCVFLYVVWPGFGEETAKKSLSVGQNI